LEVFNKLTFWHHLGSPQVIALFFERTFEAVASFVSKLASFADQVVAYSIAHHTTGKSTNGKIIN
jgi:hypothetical protein